MTNKTTYNHYEINEKFNDLFNNAQKLIKEEKGAEHLFGEVSTFDGGIKRLSDNTVEFMVYDSENGNYSISLHKNHDDRTLEVKKWREDNGKIDSVLTINMSDDPLTKVYANPELKDSDKIIGVAENVINGYENLKSIHKNKNNLGNR